VAGAAVFLPHHAFAEKNVPSVKAIPQNAADQAHNTAAQNAKGIVVQQSAVKQTGKTAPSPAGKQTGKMTPSPAMKHISKTTPSPVVKQVGRTTLPPAASRKPAVAGKNVAAQVKQKRLSALAKTDKAVKPPGQAKAAAVKETETTVSKNAVVKPAAPSFQHEMGVETKAPLLKPINKIDPNRKLTPLASSSKSREFGANVPEPMKKEKTPVSQDELPKISQMLNQTQRTNSSGGDSNDRISHGSSTINGIDKWLEWDFYQQSQLVQLYVSRQTFIQNQWTNAPPSPPPQKAPFLKA
jgi:hypothetical protein